MDHFVQVYVTSCNACQKNKASHQAKLGTPERPWEAKSVDLCGPFPKTKTGHDYVIGFICNLTQEAILLLCQKTLTAKGAADLYFVENPQDKGGLLGPLSSSIQPVHQKTKQNLCGNPIKLHEHLTG